MLLFLLRRGFRYKVCFIVSIYKVHQKLFKLSQKCFLVFDVHFVHHFFEAHHVVFIFLCIRCTSVLPPHPGWDVSDGRFVLVAKGDEVSPELVLSQRFWISDDDQQRFRSCQRDVQSFLVLQESNCSCLRPDTRQDDDQLLPSLEVLDSSDLDSVREDLHEPFALRCIRADDSDVLRRNLLAVDSFAQQTPDVLTDDRNVATIELTRAVFLALHPACVEENGNLRVWQKLPANSKVRDVLLLLRIQDRVVELLVGVVEDAGVRSEVVSKLDDVPGL
jgi:hypothetical protein